MLRRLKQETIVWTLNHGRLPCSRHVVNAAGTLAIHGYDESHRRAFFFDGHCQIDCRLSRCTFSAKNGCFFDRKRKKTENNEIYFCPEIKLAKTIQSPYFRHWKLKWSSVGLYIGPVKSSLKMTIEWDIKPDYTAAVYWLCISSLALKYYSVCHCKFCYYHVCRNAVDTKPVSDVRQRKWRSCVNGVTWRRDVCSRTHAAAGFLYIMQFTHGITDVDSCGKFVPFFYLLAVMGGCCCCSVQSL